MENSMQTQLNAFQRLVSDFKASATEMTANVAKIGAAGEDAYKAFKARVDPQSLKENIANGAAAILNKSIAQTIDASIEKAIVKRRYVVNLACCGLFALGLMIGKYFT